MPPTYQQRVLAIPLLIRLPFLLLPLPLLTLAGWWWWSYTGLYRWLAEWQIHLMNAYYPGYTGIVTLGLMGALGLAPGLLLFHILVKINAFPLDPHARPPATGQVDAWLRAHAGLMTVLIFCVVFMIFGGILLYAGLSVGPKQVVKLTDLEAGQLPPTRRIEVEGYPQWDAMLTKESHKFVPLVSAQWRPGRPVALYADVAKVPNAQAVRSPVRWEGTLAVAGLPGPVRVRYEGSAYPPGSNPQVLDVNDKPEDTASFGLTMLLVGVTVLAVTMLVWGLKLLRDRRVA
jgi:hypothetical protein